MSVSTESIEQLAINTIRTLSMDAVQQAKSGHPGTPMALAPVTYTLWNRHLKYNPAVPNWPVRDRFVLSCGHASMLLYSILHLTGVKDVDESGAAIDSLAISLDNIRSFRQLHSPCAGHPEYGDAPGIETTTGPLGQGIGNSVGMAIASQWLAEKFNRPEFEIFGFNVFALCSDGDVMEGVGCEAASLAGHLKLDNLCWIYDDNKITIEGDTDLAFSENVAKRFEALGWQVLQVDDANDIDLISRSIDQFKQTTSSPTLVVLRSVIAWGSPNKAGTHGAHGAPLGEEEVQLTKEVYGWDKDKKFTVPDEVRAHFSEGVGARGQSAYERWRSDFQRYESAFPAQASHYNNLLRGELPDGWDRDIPVFGPDESMATRASSGKVLNAIAPNVPWLLGGSADLAPSNNTNLGFDGAGHFQATDRAGRNFHFGVREHVMGAIANGMALSGLRPYVGTFFIFSDYMRPSVRLSSIMHQPVIFIYTHDSIGLGEDGPTHQPVEHLAACRAIPGLVVIRPGDANEVAQAYRTVLPINDRPVALVLTRQGLPTLCRDRFAPASGLANGAYVLADGGEDEPELILIGTGSELSIAMEAYQTLAADGHHVRLVSMPSWELFEEQDQEYRDAVLPPKVSARVAVEAGVRQGWERYLGGNGRFVGMDRFGASAPFKDLYKEFGITAENVVHQAKQLLSSARS